jgi:hypothetical protein
MRKLQKRADYRTVLVVLRDGTPIGLQSVSERHAEAAP